MAQSEGMKLIMAKVRAHIMTGTSASTPPFSLKTEPKKPEGNKEPSKPELASKSPKANAIKWPDDDIPY